MELLFDQPHLPRLILELSPRVFLFHSAQYEAHRTDVEGFEHFPNTSYLGLRATYLTNP